MAGRGRNAHPARIAASFYSAELLDGHATLVVCAQENAFRR
jgi:hypothetical protein